MIEELLATPDGQALWGHWPSARSDGFLTVLPTSLAVRYEDTRLRTKELVEFEGLTVSQAAERLAAEGHRNAHRRHVWYQKAVRDVLEQGL